jgi:hypothetical protein
LQRCTELLLTAEVRIIQLFTAIEAAEVVAYLAKPHGTILAREIAFGAGRERNHFASGKVA